MKYVDLINVIPEEDKQTIVNYIDCFGVKKENFIGVENWLQPWSHSNQKLYKLLGNKLIREFKFKYEKPVEVLRREINDKLISSEFKASYHEFYNEKIYDHKNEFDINQIKFFNHLLDISNFIEDKITFGIKYKAPSAKKMLQIQPGAKPLRAISRVIDYFKNDYTFKGFENFRVQHSLVMNDKIINGTICISIHPLDFMSMSDNASNWQSCMSWVHDGCYRSGTIEMMNSNCVVCAYLKNTSTPFVFAHPSTGEIRGEWVNKAWRQLFYINKDIIMSGKAYPYIQEDITKFVLNTLKDLAKENLNWSYEFGIEPYKDMLHIDDLYKMNKQRAWMHAKSQVKNNIIWDTKGMYNDMLNDNEYPYLCYRNKVNHTKIYSASGKCNCLQCGDSVIEFEEDEEDNYNDRYYNVGAVLCRQCYNSYESCNCCDSYAPTTKLNTFTINNHTFSICDNCFEERVKICPCCGKPMFINTYNEKRKFATTSELNYKDIKDTFFAEKEEISDDFYMYDPLRVNQKEMGEYLAEDTNNLEKIYICKDCKEKLIDKNTKELENMGILTINTVSYWGNPYIYYIFEPERYKDWRYYNLKSVDINTFKAAA